MKSHQSKPHPILAGFADLYFTAFILLALGGLLINDPLQYSATILMVFFALLVAVITYHGWGYKKCKKLTVGEKIAGKFLEKGQKHWKNPYSKSRAFMFLVVILTIFITGSEMNGFIQTQLTGLAFLLKFIKISLLYWGLVWLGQGKLKGVWFGFGVFLVASLLAGLFLTTGEPMARFPFILNLTLLLLYLGVFFSYRKA